MVKDVGDVVHRVCVKFLRLVDEKYTILYLLVDDAHKASWHILGLVTKDVVDRVLCKVGLKFCSKLGNRFV